MAKIQSQYDISTYSPLLNLFGAKTATARREWGAVEYDTTLNVNSGGSKVLLQFDLSAYSQLVNKAGVTPTTKDMRGATISGAQREWGALEYNSAIALSATPKLISNYDLAKYSALVNFNRQTSNPYRPTTKDLRGTSAPSNVGARLSSSSIVQVPTINDLRGTSVVGSIRELGALEADSSLVISTDALSSTEISNAVWQTTKANLTNTLESAGAFQASSTLRTATAQAGGATTITLDGNASSINDFYNNQFVVILTGTGVGQSRLISSYVGSTRVATVDTAWLTNPDNTSVFAIVPFVSVPSSASTADAVWGVQTSTQTTAGTMGKQAVDTKQETSDNQALIISK